MKLNTFLLLGLLLSLVLLVSSNAAETPKEDEAAKPDQYNGSGYGGYRGYAGGYGRYGAGYGYGGYGGYGGRGGYGSRGYGGRRVSGGGEANP